MAENNNIRGELTITLGGKPVKLAARLRIVPDLEAATGVGLLTLFGHGVNMRVTHAADVLAIANVAAGGKLTTVDVLDAMEVEGPGAHVGNALRVLMALINVPNKGGSAPAKKR